MAEQLYVEGNFKDGSGRKIDPEAQCPDGLLHHFKQVPGKKGDERCIKCGLTKKFINYLLKIEEDGPKKCKCGKADSGFCLECNRECPACHSKMHDGVCVYCDGKDYSHM